MAVDEGVAAKRFDRFLIGQAVEAVRARHPLITDLLVALTAVLIAVLGRISLEQLVGGVAPFMLTFPAVIAATLLAGSRAGVAAAVICQALTLWFVFPHWSSGRIGLPAITNLLLSCLSLAATIWAVSSYRQMSARLRAQCEREVDTLSLLIQEMDHRAKNNFQIAANLLGVQAREADNSEAALELDRAAGRMVAIGSIYHALAFAGNRSERLDLGEYVEDIVGLLRQGALPDGVELTLCRDRMILPAQSAMMIGLIVNEWITNAIKYAFPAGRGTIAVEARRRQGMLIVTVDDDGCGVGGGKPGGGAGSRLIPALAKAIDATIAIHHDAGVGTRCRLQLGHSLPDD